MTRRLSLAIIIALATLATSAATLFLILKKKKEIDEFADEFDDELNEDLYKEFNIEEPSEPEEEINIPPLSEE